MGPEGMNRLGRAGLSAATILVGFITTAMAGERSGVHLARQPALVELFQMPDRVEWQRRGDDIPPVPHRLSLEITGARLQAEDWLRDAGVAVLEEHDAEGHRSFTLLSDTFASQSPVLHLRARFGRPELAAGLRLRQSTATIGLVIPWQQSVIEFEAVNDRRLGYGFLGSLHWQDAHDRFQCGVAMPVAAGGVAVLLQLQMRFH